MPKSKKVPKRLYQDRLYILEFRGVLSRTRNKRIPPWKKLITFQEALALKVAYGRAGGELSDFIDGTDESNLFDQIFLCQVPDEIYEMDYADQQAALAKLLKP